MPGEERSEDGLQPPNAGAPLGILMLDTRFPRPVGDGGNPASYPFPAIVRRVAGASVERAVRRDPSLLLSAFLPEAQALVMEGCAAITTTCGFLVPLQRALADALPVPVATSSLLQVAPIATRLGDPRRVGILSIAASSLTPAHLRAARVPDRVPVGSLEGTSFARSILGDLPTLGMNAARHEHVRAALALCETYPTVEEIVLECTNMPPYAAAIERATGRRVHSILTLCAEMMDRAGTRG